jgi:hypothetical protein
MMILQELTTSKTNSSNITISDGRIQSCLSKDNNTRLTKKVRFAKQGLLFAPSPNLTFLGMARKKATITTRPTSTPTRTRRPQPSKIVGSSCTWRVHELEECNVSYKQGEVDPKSLFDEPERWFNFDELKHYRKGTCLYLCVCG